MLKDRYNNQSPREIEQQHRNCQTILTLVWLDYLEGITPSRPVSLTGFAAQFLQEVVDLVCCHPTRRTNAHATAARPVPARRGSESGVTVLRVIVVGSIE